MIDLVWCINKGACYADYALARLFPLPRSLRQVLTLQEGYWKLVPIWDRLWVWYTWFEWEDKNVCRTILADIMPIAEPEKDWTILKSFDSLTHKEQMNHYTTQEHPAFNPNASTGFFDYLCRLDAKYHVWFFDYLIKRFL